MEFYYKEIVDGKEKTYSGKKSNKKFIKIKGSIRHNLDHLFDSYDCIMESEDFYFLSDGLFSFKIKKDEINNGFILLKDKNSMDRLNDLFNKAKNLKKHIKILN